MVWKLILLTCCLRLGRLNTNAVLQKIQRLALLMITSCSRTCPTAALECMLNVPPLYIFILGEAVAENYRIMTSPFESISKLVDEWLMKEIMQSDTLKILHTDKCLKIRNLHTGINFCTPEREEWNYQVKNLNKFDETWFTDGSKTSKGTGAAYINFNETEQ